MSDLNLQSSGYRLNIEIKARCKSHSRLREVLKSRSARLVGTDHQVDTYFNVLAGFGVDSGMNAPAGRLKLREGTIENSLIFYQRPDQPGPKQSDVLLAKLSPDPALKAVLTASNGVLVVVDKQREIWFDDNVKLHLDQVEGLGRFVEIEAIDADGSYSVAELKRQCNLFMDLFEINSTELVDRSYSDMLLAVNKL